MFLTLFWQNNIKAINCLIKYSKTVAWIHATVLLFALSMIFASKNYSSTGFMFVYTF